MPWLVALAVLVLFTPIQIATARQWRPRLPERVVPIYRRPRHEPPNPIVLRAFCCGAVRLFHTVWLNGVTVLAELYALREIHWALVHTAHHPRNRLTSEPDVPTSPSDPLSD